MRQCRHHRHRPCPRRPHVRERQRLPRAHAGDGRLPTSNPREALLLRHSPHRGRRRRPPLRLRLRRPRDVASYHPVLQRHERPAAWVRASSPSAARRQSRPTGASQPSAKRAWHSVSLHRHHHRPLPLPRQRHGPGHVRVPVAIHPAAAAGPTHPGPCRSRALVFSLGRRRPRRPRPRRPRRQGRRLQRLGCHSGPRDQPTDSGSTMCVLAGCCWDCSLAATPATRPSTPATPGGASPTATSISPAVPATVPCNVRRSSPPTDRRRRLPRIGQPADHALDLEFVALSPPPRRKRQEGLSLSPQRHCARPHALSHSSSRRIRSLATSSKRYSSDNSTARSAWPGVPGAAGWGGSSSAGAVVPRRSSALWPASSTLSFGVSPTRPCVRLSRCECGNGPGSRAAARQRLRQPPHRRRP
jgi:hypothetical protein